jgi:hypothetical protein
VSKRTEDAANRRPEHGLMFIPFVLFVHLCRDLLCLCQLGLSRGNA